MTPKALKVHGNNMHRGELAELCHKAAVSRNLMSKDTRCADYDIQARLLLLVSRALWDERDAIEELRSMSFAI